MTPSHNRPRLITLLLLVLIGGPGRVASLQDADRQALLDLNRQLLESVFVRGETGMLASTALPNLVVVPPGGVVENRQQVLNGVASVAGAEAVEVDDVVIAEHGTTAVLVSRVRTKRDNPVAGTSKRGTTLSEANLSWSRSPALWRCRDVSARRDTYLRPTD